MTIGNDSKVASHDCANIGEAELKDFLESVESLTKTYDPSKDLGSEEQSEYESTEKVGYCNMIFRYADGGDKCLFTIATIMSIGFAAMMPGFAIMMGELMGDVGGNSLESLGDNLWVMVGLGGICFVSAMGFIVCYSLFAVSISNKIKLAEFRECLNKSSSWYDFNNSNTIAAKIAKEQMSIQRGSGDKLGLIISGYVNLLLSFALSFYYGWIYTLILIIFMPIMGGVGGIFSMLSSQSVTQ